MASRGGPGAQSEPEGPGARAVLTQAPTSRRAAASSSRIGPMPGNRSGLRKRLSTAWASSRPRATRRSRAHDCGEQAGVRKAAPTVRAAPRRLARLTQGRGGSLLGRKEQLRGLQLRVSSSCGTRVGVRLSLLAALPKRWEGGDSYTWDAPGRGRLCGWCTEPRSSRKACTVGQRHPAVALRSPALRRGTESAWRGRPLGPGTEAERVLTAGAPRKTPRSEFCPEIRGAPAGRWDAGGPRGRVERSGRHSRSGPSAP